MTLTGKTILIALSKDQSTEFRTLLEARGATVICLPTIEIANPDSWEPCDRVIWKLAEYHGVYFISKNAVTKFIERIRSLRPQAVDTLATRNIYAVGEKTRQTLESCGFSVVASTVHASVQELAAILQAHQIQGAKILLPKSQIARDELPNQLRKMGAEVDEVVVYKTVMPNAKKVDRVNELLKKNQIDIISFFSPSSAVNYTEILECELISSVTSVAIGPSTAEVLNQLGLKKIIVSQKPTIEGMVQTIDAYVHQIG